MKIRTIFLLLFTLILNPSFSQLNIENDHLINDYDTERKSDKQNIKAVVNNLGTTLIAWEDERNGLLSIFCQFFDSNGEKIGGNKNLSAVGNLVWEGQYD